MNQEFTECGMPIFIDTSGHLSAEQKSYIYRQLSVLEEREKDNREWLNELQEKADAEMRYNREWVRELESRIEDLYECKQDKKPWWKIW